MPVLWSCPDPNCPPTATAPEDVPEAGEQAGADAEARFTTDEVARLLNVPLDTIHQWHLGRRRASGLSDTQGEPLPKERRGPVVGGARGIPGYLPKRLLWDLQARWVHDG